MVGQKRVWVMQVMQMVWACIICNITCIFAAIVVEDMIDKKNS